MKKSYLSTISVDGQITHANIKYVKYERVVNVKCLIVVNLEMISS